MSVDIEAVATRIAEIAQDEIMARFGKLDPEEIREKSSPTDLVTEVDEATERALEKALTPYAPGAGFIGEELAAKNPRSVEALKGDGAFWIVDPLDGTRNFVHGAEEFGVIVALVVDGVTRAGWIYAAPQDDCALAERGEGATWRGDPIAPPGALRARPIALRSIGWMPPDRQERMRTLMKAEFESRPSHCSAYAYIKLAIGEADLQVSSLIHPWDHAAGALLVAEAGGHAAFLDTAAPYDAMPSVRRPLLVTSPGRAWETFADVLRRA